MGKKKAKKKFAALATAPTANQRVLEFLADTREEYASSLEKHGGFNSAHEGWAVLFEEVDELWDEVRKKRKDRSGGNMYLECKQIAAMALKFAIFVALPAKESGQ